MRRKRNKQKGFFLPIILIFAALFFAYATALVAYSMANIKTTSINNKKISALSIAEAGINYYLWHMEHYPSDYYDLQYDAADNVLSGAKKDIPQSVLDERPELEGFTGPYEHEYKNDSGEVIGSYKLYIKEPALVDGEMTKPLVRSEGQLKDGGPIKKIIVEVLSKGLTDYAAYSNGSKYPLLFPTNVEFFGPLHSNGPIYFAASFNESIPDDSKIVTSSIESFNPNLEFKFGNATIPERLTYCTTTAPITCPGIWGVRLPLTGVVDFPVSTINADNVINDDYFDGLKQKAISDTNDDPSNPMYFDKNTIGAKYPLCTGPLGLKFTNNGIDIYRMWIQDGIYKGRDVCHAIPDSVIDASKSRVIYFDNITSDASYKLNSDSGDLWILGGEFDNRATVVSSGRMFISDMNLSYSSSNAIIGIITKNSFRPSYKHDFISSAEMAELKIQQNWDASFLSTTGFIQCFTSTPSVTPARGELNLFGSMIDMWGVYDSYNINTTYDIWTQDWQKINITPNPAPAPPGFPVLQNVGISSWREE